MKRVGRILGIASCILLTAGCDDGGKPGLFQPARPDLVDPDLNLTRDDYKSFTDPVGSGENGTLKPGSANVIEPPIPDLAEILAAPKPPKLGETKLVSIAVTDDVPMKDVLIELARLADVDIEVDAGITGGISFRAKDRPFNEVVERIADLAGLRFTMKGNVLRVERDTPFVQIYSLDFLNIDRSSQSSVSISTNVLSGGGSGSSGSGSSDSGSSNSNGSSSGSSGSSGGALNSGSSSSVTTKADSDFWKQFEESVKQILTYSQSKRISNVDIAEQTQAKDKAATPGAGGAAPAPAAPAPVAAAAASTEGKATAGSFYILNRQGSTLTISATQKQHELISEFLRKIQSNASAQVLIEAKIVEVTLDNEFQSGIDWTRLGSDKISFTGNFSTPAAVASSNTGKFNFGTPHQLAFMKGLELSTVVKLAQSFGTTRTLSSPRLHAINNQEAVLTFAQNYVYFELSVQQTQSASTTVGTGTSTGLNTITVNSTLHTVPVGIILSLQPSINTDTDEVTLSIRPTLSRITGTVSDPAVAFLIAQAKAQGVTVDVTNAVPVIEVRELDSILKLKSGQVMVIGGLMQDISANQDSGLPGISHVPVFGNLFKGVDKQNNTQELVIFIRATIVNSGGNAAQADKTLYEKYTKDPRPIDF